MGRVAVPKTGQKPLSPRRDATEVPVGRVAVPKTGQKNSLPRRVGSGALVGRVPVPKTGQKNSLPRRDASGVPVGRVVVPKQIVRRIIMVEVKVLVGYAPWQMVSGGIGSRKEGPDGDKWSKTTQETLGGSGGSEAERSLPQSLPSSRCNHIYGKETD